MNDLTNIRAGVRAIVALAAILAVITSSLTAAAHPPADNLHGGSGVGVKVVGHSDLGGQGLNAHLAVLGNHAFVGFGTNGGFASQWNKTPRCREQGPEAAGTVKVVSLADAANPTVVSTIIVTAFDPTISSPEKTLARDVAAARVSTPFFTGDLLAVALESCNASSEGLVGINFYDVTDPANPKFLSRDDRFLGNVATRGVSLVQRPDGRVLAMAANQGSQGGIHVLDVTNPLTPVQVGAFPQSQFSSVSKQECRPFNFAQGVIPNKTGTKAYVSYYDEGLMVLDTALPEPLLPKLSQTKYPASEEGNSFRFIPNDSETLALATDEDLLPAKTTLTIASGSAAGTYRGCEAIWGSPLYRRTTPSLDAQIVFVGGAPGESGNRGCTASDYSGIDAAGKLVLTFRGGCNFQTKARIAQDKGGVGLLIANTVPDHHGGGTGVLFSVDSSDPVDASVAIPLVMITQEAGNAISNATKTETVTATLADSAETWGALRVFGLSGGTPAQTAVFNAPNTTTLPSDEGLYHAVQATWAGDQAAVAWMSDGMRVVDLRDPSAPKGRAFYVPPGVADPTGNYPAVPLVVDVERFGDRFVITDVNGGLYILNVVLNRDQCKDGGWQSFGFANQGECVTLFDDDPV